MGKAIKYQDLARLYECQGPEQTCAHLAEAMRQKHLRPDDFSIRDLAYTFIENGHEWVDAIDPRRKSGRMSLREAATAVDTSAFANITGQIVFSRILDAFEDPAFLWPDLCETVPTTFLEGEKIPGIGRIGDAAAYVDEGMPFPTVGLNEEYIETSRTQKRGMIVPVSREIIVADRTGILLKRAAEVGYWLGLNKEKRVLDVALGVVNNYKRNGVATNTYLSSGAYVNVQAANKLDGSANEWRALENAELLFDAILDPNTNEPVAIIPNTIIVPSALKHTAMRIMSATEVVTVDNTTTNNAAIRTVSGNPLSGRNYKILSGPQVKSRSGSAVNWWCGDPKRAFAYFQVWDIETVQAASNSEAEFTQDIMLRYKASERGVAQVIEPRRMVKSTA